MKMTLMKKSCKSNIAINQSCSLICCFACKLIQRVVATSVETIWHHLYCLTVYGSSRTSRPLFRLQERRSWQIRIHSSVSDSHYTYIVYVLHWCCFVVWSWSHDVAIWPQIVPMETVCSALGETKAYLCRPCMVHITYYSVVNSVCTAVWTAVVSFSVTYLVNHIQYKVKCTPCVHVRCSWYTCSTAGRCILKSSPVFERISSGETEPHFADCPRFIYDNAEKITHHYRTNQGLIQATSSWQWSVSCWWPA